MISRVVSTQTKFGDETWKTMRAEKKNTTCLQNFPPSHNPRLQVRELQVHLVHSKDAFLESVPRGVGNTIAREALEFTEEIDVLGSRVRHVVYKRRTLQKCPSLSVHSGLAVRRPRLAPVRAHDHSFSGSIV